MYNRKQLNNANMTAVRYIRKNLLIAYLTIDNKILLYDDNDDDEFVAFS